MAKVKKEKKKKSWKNRLINVGIVLLIFIGLGLIFNKSIRNFIIQSNIDNHQISHYSAKQLEENKKNAKGNFDFSSVQSIDFSSVMAGKLSSQPLPVVGGVAVPDVGINLPIFIGVGNLELAMGAGTLKENQQMGEGNYALASHNVTGYNQSLSLLFTPLEHAKTGMLIYITDKTTVYEYKINSIKYVSPSDVSVINDVPGKKMVTLITCFDGSRQREIVQGDLVSSYSFSTAPDQVHKAFETSYNQLPY